MKLKQVRAISAVLIACAIIVGYALPSPAQEAVLVQSRETGTVVDIIDTDAIVVKLHSSGKPAYVRMIGVKGNAGNEGVDYLIANVLGKNVIIDPDYTTNVTLQDGRWNLLYVYMNNSGGNSTANKELLNDTMIKKGYAVVDNDFKDIAQYASLLSGERSAKSSKIGVWSEDGKGSYYYSGDMVNINTASSSKFKEYLKDIPSSVVSNIIDYRKYNPFQSVSEVKFVDGMTAELYDQYRSEMTVVTNINRASDKELKTLVHSSDSEIKKLINYRDKQRITKLTDLHNKAGLSRSFYDDNRYYISLTDEDTIDYMIPDKAVNINTATATQITNNSDLTSSQASKIVSGRTNGYTYKTLMEITQLSGIGISEKVMHRHTDNLHLVTDLNEASKDEIRSLFGNQSTQNAVDKIMNKRPFNRMTLVSDELGATVFNSIEDYIYFYGYTAPERTNLNFASSAQLSSLGFSNSEINSIVAKQRKMNQASDIPLNVSRFNDSISLYTDINTASIHELRSLNRLSDKMITLIVSYRNDQPFGDKREIRDFFDEQDELSTYNYISDFLVVR